MSLGKPFSRRLVLRGAGVALTLPWLESWRSGEARAQSQPAPLRFLPIYLPNGAPDFWKPQAVGSGVAWALSSVLEPLAALKSKVTVVSGLENGSVFNADGGPSVTPEHALQAGAWLTCVDSRAVRAELGVQEANGTSVDQMLAASAAFQNGRPPSSLQVGLSSAQSYCDAEPCSLSRSVSWQTPTLPLYKLVDPKKVFDQLVGAASNGPGSEEGLERRAARKSILDAVLESAATVRPKVSAHDKLRMDEFLDSVRRVEQRVDEAPTVANNCSIPAAPNFPPVGDGAIYRQNTATYNKGTHADLMNDLIVMAFQCDVTRVISYMLEDERCEFYYDHVGRRTFTPSTSTPGTGVCGSYLGAQHGSVDEFASITWWNVGKVAELCQKLDTLAEAGGRSVLDNSVVFLGSCSHGQNHQCAELPSLLVGGGGGRLKTDQHLALGSRPLRDLYFTLLSNVFGAGVTDFGTNRTGAALRPIVELLTA